MRALTARDVMNPEVLAVRDDQTVADLADFLVDNEISGAPVEDAEGQLIGVVSLTDVARVLGGHDQAVIDHPQPEYYLRGWEDRFNPEDVAGLRIAESDLTVGEIMTPQVFAVEDEMPISKVAEKMIHGHLHRLLVTRDRKVVGIISTSDLLGLLVEDA
ncbi:MAG: CBS domain-containing protein [Thermoanaerobaculia bacterium]|nr:MAG: CBS domain-containing protein [Thermoanaerobaculia bacterium]MBZ0103319.1 CBS domain-containing protein [Thermoanaerobaculia bacterium]